MMIKTKKILYKSFDSILSEKENKMLIEELYSLKKLREEKYKIEKLRIILTTEKNYKFNAGFETNLLNKMSTADYPQIFIYNEMKFAFKKIIFASVLTALILFGISFAEEGYINFDRIFGTQKVKIEDVLYYEFSSLDKNFFGEKNGL